jgi:hypothetical protein
MNLLIEQFGSLANEKRCGYNCCKGPKFQISFQNMVVSPLLVLGLANPLY